MQEARLFAYAIQFLTIMPMPQAKRLATDWLNRSAKYFPLVGLLVGALSAMVLLLAAKIWSGVVPALLAVIASIVITGALHEDGLADTADGLVGGRSLAERLDIMRDSRLGTYGGLALGLSTALRVAALAATPADVAAAALLGAHGGGRMAAVSWMAVARYADDPRLGRIVYPSDSMRTMEIALAAAFALMSLVPLLLIAGSVTIVAIAVGGFAAACVAWFANTLIGGYTGDILGAVEQVFEAGLLLAVAALVAS